MNLENNIMTEKHKIQFVIVDCEIKWKMLKYITVYALT